MQANQGKSSWVIRKRHVLKVCQPELTVVRRVDSWSFTLTLSSQRNKVAEQGHWTNAGGSRQSPIRTRWAARAAQFVGLTPRLRRSDMFIVPPC